MEKIYIEQLRAVVPSQFLAEGLMTKGLLGDLPCWDTDNGFRYFDPETEFLSYCLTSSMAAVMSLLAAGPLLVTLFELSSQVKGRSSIAGLVNRVLALIVPLLRLSVIYLAGEKPTIIEWVTIAVSAIAASVVWVEDGRVAVSSPDVLLYYLGAAFIWTSEAIDAFLRDAIGKWLMSIDACVVTLILVLALWNPDRGNQPGKRVEFDKATIFEKISLSFVTKMLRKGSNEKVDRTDLPKLPQGLNAVNVTEKLITVLETKSQKSKYRVILSIVQVLRSEITILVVIESVTQCFTYLQPSILALFLNALEAYQAGTSSLFPAFYFAVLIGVFPMISTSLDNVAQLMSAYTYVVSRTSLTTTIYHKALRLTPRARESFDSSKIMNLINVDTDQIDGVASVLPTLVSAPIALVLSTFQLYRFIGKAMFAGIGFYVIFVPWTAWVSQVMAKMFPEIMAIKDRRNKVTSNAFRNIKSLKLYAWEKPYYDRIADIRSNEELAKSRKVGTIAASMQASWSVLGDLVAVGVFIAYLWFQMGELNPGVIFPTLLLLQYVTFPFMMLPTAITSLARAINSQTRINELLTQPDHTHENHWTLPSRDSWDSSTIDVRDATVSWNGDDTEDKIALRDINFTARRGDLVCLIGRVGAGKTALLKSIAGELEILSGSITVNGTVAYCSQESWLQNRTLKENILFGKKYDEDFYQRTLDACDLLTDISQLPEKDDTAVGERGISLSGGQKARASLARAVYSRADVYLLDDVLSAVDEHVSAHLIEKLFATDGLLAGKTIILATNNVKVLSHASQIIAIQEKRVVEKLSFRDVVEKKEESTIYRLIREFGKAKDLEQESENMEDRRAAISRSASSSKLFRRSSIETTEVADVSRQSSDEEDETNEVSLTIFRRYFDVVGSWYLVFAIVVMVISVVVSNSSNIWVGFMSNHNFHTIAEAKWYLAVYVGIALASSLLIFGTSFWFLIIVCLNVSRILHNNMLWNLMHAPMSFFDHTPLGRLINRFTGDITTLDNTLPVILYYVVRSIMNAIMGLVTVVVGSPVVIIVIIPLFLLGNEYRRIYVPTSRQISRMTSAANSPMLSHIEESLKGASIVRAFDRTRQFEDLYNSHVDYWVELAFLKTNLGRWLTFRIQGMTSVLQLAAALSLTVLVSQERISVGYCAVVLHFSARVGIMVQQTLNGLASLEVSGVSLERILEYIDQKQEAPSHIPETEPEAAWPEHGSIAFDDFSTRYKPDGADVLKRLSFSINENEKIGIVGRTGSGKSTLTLALFRILEASGGHIEIDSKNTSHLGLFDLRSRLSIIPQDAQIFDGTLRENLDPFRRASDVRLWEVLELCHLKQHFERLGTGLDTTLADGGDNLSRGQSQLVCLGRALIHETKILVLDEATASVDVETDSVLQQTIRNQFKNRTIVTIAHRLNTIMDSDRILVLDHGEIKEFDTPQNLLDSKGLFWKLANTEEAKKGEPIG